MRFLALILATAVFLLPHNLFALTSNTHATSLVHASNQYWSITDASQTGLDITGDMTISGWFYTPDLPSAWNNGWNTLVAKADFATAKAYFFGSNYNAGNVSFSFLIDNGSESNSTQQWASNPTEDTWYHVAVAYTASAGSVTFYVNGVANGAAVTGARTSISNTATAFTVGTALNSGSATRNTNVYIDDVRIWSRVLTAGEIEDMYTDPCTVDNGASLQGWWIFDNDAGVDQTANNNDLTNNNSATFTTERPYNCASAATPEDDTFFDLFF